MSLCFVPGNFLSGSITLNRTPVSSTDLRAIGYNAAENTLEVEFLHGGVYSYSGVPASVHAGLMSASSHGTYFDAHVKKGGYPYKKLP